MGIDDDMSSWKERLAAAEADLDQREERALQEAPTPAELAALAAERDKLADERDHLAAAEDEAAARRDVAALARDARASGRDIAARGRTGDSDEGFADRYLSAVDRDTAAGDRASAHDNRAAAGEGRVRAAASRARAARDRDAALGIASGLEAEVAGLRRALETRNLIGQAQGVLIERYGMGPDESFRALVRLSQEHNVKLREAAGRLVEAIVAERGASSQHLAAPPTNQRPRVGRGRVNTGPSGRSSAASNPLAGGGYR